MALSHFRKRPVMPRPVYPTMVPIHHMREELGPKFDDVLAEAGGYFHAWGTGNRAHRRMMAAVKRQA